MTLPYENASSGKAAVEDMRKPAKWRSHLRGLQGFGAGSFGVMEDFAAGEVIVQFVWRERRVTIKASAKGYAAAWLRHHPYTYRMRVSQIEHERRALAQANISVYSILRDWIKGQLTAVEVGMLSFEGAFLGQIPLASGETVLERVVASEMLALPPPSASNPEVHRI